MPAIREDKTGKPDWELTLTGFKKALEELCFARSYSAERHTDTLLKLDGRTNWAESMGTEHHEHWIRICLSAAMRHITERMAGVPRDETQLDLHHLAFAVQNLLMVMEYDFHEEQKGGEVERKDR